MRGFESYLGSQCGSDVTVSITGSNPVRVGSNPTARASHNAVVAQWLERLLAKEKVEGPIPFRRSNMPWW